MKNTSFFIVPKNIKESKDGTKILKISESDNVKISEETFKIKIDSIKKQFNKNY